MTSELDTLLAKQALYELSCQYMRGLDRTDPALLRSVFFDDAYCEYGFINGGPDDFVEYAITALQGHEMNQHMIGNALFDIEGDEAFGEVYFNAYHKIKGVAGFEDIIIAVRYLVRYEKRAGQWKMAYRSERVDWSRTQPTNDPYFEMAPDTLLGARLDDAVYDRDARRKTS